jgi:hypothetical protein
MSIFEKWAWIKRNWLYVIEEATKLNLVFVGGTALNLAFFHERLLEISKTKKEDLLIFQTREQVDRLPYDAFEKFKEQTYGWLSRFR